MASSLELLLKKLFALVRKVGRPSSLGEGGLDATGVLVLEFVAFREVKGRRSGVDLGGDDVAV